MHAKEEAVRGATAVHRYHRFRRGLGAPLLRGSNSTLMASYPVDGPGGALVSLLICLGVGGAIGALNGVLVAVLRLQSIAATLGTMIMGQGLALVIMDAPGGTIADWVSYTLTDVPLRNHTDFGAHRTRGRGLMARLPPHRHLRRHFRGRRG